MGKGKGKNLKQIPNWLCKNNTIREINLIYLLHYNLSPATTGSARINAKEREERITSEKREEKERDQGTEGATPAIVALIGDK